MKRFFSLFIAIVILCPLLFCPVQAFADASARSSYYVKIVQPRDGFKQSGINMQTMWIDYVIPYNGNVSDIKMTVFGYSEDFNVYSHTFSPVDDSGTAIQGFARLEGLVDFDKTILMTIVVTDYLGNKYSDSVSVVSYSYDNMVDDDEDGLDDRVPSPLPPVPVPIANYYGKDIMKNKAMSDVLWKAYDTLTLAEKSEYRYMLVHELAGYGDPWGTVNVCRRYSAVFFAELPSPIASDNRLYNDFSYGTRGKVFYFSGSPWSFTFSNDIGGISEASRCNKATCKSSSECYGGKNIRNWSDENSFHSVRYLVPPGNKVPDSIISGGGSLPTPTPTPTVTPAPIPTPPPSGGGEVLPEHYVSINLPRDGYVTSQLNAMSLTVHYKVPYNGNTKDVKIKVNGYRTDREAYTEHHTIEVINDGKTLEGHAGIVGAVPWNVPTKLEVVITAYDGSVYSDSVTVTAYEDFIDENNDGLDDRTNEDEWDGPPDFGGEPPPSGGGGGSGGFPNFESIINSVSGFTSGFVGVISSFFTFLPPEFVGVLVFGFSCLIILRIAGR